MAYVEVQPAARLQSLVAAVWAFPTHLHAHRVLPDGCMDILFTEDGAVVVGAMQQAALYAAAPGAKLGIRLRPGEAARLFAGLPGELTDASAALGALWGDDGMRIEDEIARMLEAATRTHLDANAILLLGMPRVEQLLAERLAGHGLSADVRTREAAALLARGFSVAEVARRIGMSERQLSRRFSERVGLSPKTYARVRRFQTAALLMQGGASPADAAAEVGYADQPHFTREASALAGTTPRVLASELSDGLDTAVPVVL